MAAPSHISHQEPLPGRPFIHPSQHVIFCDDSAPSLTLPVRRHLMFKHLSLGLEALHAVFQVPPQPHAPTGTEPHTVPAGPQMAHCRVPTSVLLLLSLGPSIPVTVSSAISARRRAAAWQLR